MVEGSPHLVSLAFSSQSNDTKAGQRLMGDSRAHDCQGQDARPQRRSWLARRENMGGVGGQAGQGSARFFWVCLCHRARVATIV